jgi:DNA-binding response OmpR family regulator
VPRRAVLGAEVVGADVAATVAAGGAPHVPPPVPRALLAWLGGLLVQAGGGRTAAERALAAPAERPQPAVRFGDVEVFPEAHRVTRAGEPVALRPKALALLLALAAQPGRTLSRRALLREVWGYHGDTASRTVDTHMAELRRKLERDPARPAHLLGVRTVGYQLRP